MSNSDEIRIADISLAHDMAQAEAPYREWEVRAHKATKAGSGAVYFAARAEWASDSVLYESGSGDIPEPDPWDYINRLGIRIDFPQVLRNVNDLWYRHYYGTSGLPEITEVDDAMVGQLVKREASRRVRDEKSASPEYQEQLRIQAAKLAGERSDTQRRYLYDYSFSTREAHDPFHAEQIRATLGAGMLETVYPYGENSIVRKDELSAVVGRTLFTIGADMLKHEVDPEELRLSPWGRWKKSSPELISSRLLGKFNGTVSNYRLTPLPVTEEWKDKYFKDGSSVEADHIRRVRMAVDLKSTGRAPIVSQIDSAVYLRMEDAGPMIYSTARKADQVSGERERALLVAEARTIADIVRQNASIVSGGLPTLGKRR